MFPDSKWTQQTIRVTLSQRKKFFFVKTKKTSKGDNENDHTAKTARVQKRKLAHNYKDTIYYDNRRGLHQRVNIYQTNHKCDKER